MTSNDNSTIDVEGNVPKRRFINPSNPKSGQWLHEQVRNFILPGDLKDWERQRIESHLRLAAPYSTAELTALGMENMPNYSRGDMAMRIGDEERKWTDLVTSHNGLWEVDNPYLPSEIAERIHSELADILNTVWSSSPAHVTTLQLVFRQFSCYGPGPVLWPDRHDPSPISRVASDFRFPRGFRIDLSNFTECALLDKLTPQEMYRAVNNPIMDSGWKKEEVMKILRNYSSEEEECRNCFISGEAMELAMREGRNPWKNYKTQEISVIHCWVDEFDEKDDKSISYIMIAQCGDEHLILKELPFFYSNPNEFLLLATDRVGSDGKLSGLRGLGMEIREKCESNDVLTMAAAFGAYQSSVPTYQSANQAVTDSLEQMTLRANGAIIPAGLTQVEAKLDIRNAMAFVDSANSEMDEQQGRYGLNAPNKGGVQRTAEEARQDSAKEGEIRSSQVVPLTVTFFTPLGQNFLTRLLKFPRDDKGKPLKFKGHEVVAKFDKKLKRSGILDILAAGGLTTWEMQKEILLETEVAFNSANTPGGLDKKLLRAGEMMRWLPYMTSQAQRDSVLNSAMVSLNGWRGAQPYLNKTEADIAAAPFQERISVENGIMRAGSAMSCFEFQDHLRHLGPLDPAGFGHCAFLMAELQKVQQNMGNQFESDPLDGLGEDITGLLNLKEHVDQHLAFAAHNPAIIESDAIQPYFTFVAEVEQNLSKMAKGFMAELEQRQAQGQNVDPKVQAQMQLTQAKIASMQAETTAKIQQGNLKHNIKVAQTQELAGMRSELKRASTLTDMAIKAEKDLNATMKERMSLTKMNAATAAQLRAKEEAEKAKMASSDKDD